MSILSETTVDLAVSDLQFISSVREEADEIALAKMDLAVESEAIDSLIECGDCDGKYDCEDCDKMKTMMKTISISTTLMKMIMILLNLMTTMKMSISMT